MLWGRSKRNPGRDVPSSARPEAFAPAPIPILRQDPTTSAPSDSKRKLWFRRSTHPPPTPPSPKPSTYLETATLVPLAGETEERLRPVQFQPNRVATLYVTPSDRNLYLAAMAQLDRTPAALPLWSEPAPILPDVSGSEPFDADRLRRILAETAPPTTSPERQALALGGLDPKLVRSPQAGVTGLQMREEFRPRQTRAPSRQALVVLAVPSTVKFVGFPAEAFRDAEKTITSTWSAGVKTRSDHPVAHGDDTESKTWTIQLNGQVWKRVGTEELDPIRLLLAVFAVLARQGWRFEGLLQVGKGKKDVHNLLFSYSEAVQSWPPLFFAISYSLPDRIALISPPSKGTPALLGAIRDAISDVLGKKGKGGIKAEGWLYEGVYRFGVDGWRGLRGKLKLKRIREEQPLVLLKLLTSITDLHYEFVGSIPLLPLSAGRDVLFFSSQPGSGLSIDDSFRPSHPAAGNSRPISMIMVDKSESMLDLSQTPQTAAASPAQHANTRNVDQHRGGLEPIGIAAQRDTGVALPLLPPAHHSAPVEPIGPVAGGDSPSSPRTRNLLVKKNSVRRPGSSASRKAPPPAEPQSKLPPSAIPGPRQADYRPEADERWTLINPPPDITVDGPTAGSTDRASTADSASSVYVDADPVDEPAHTSDSVPLLPPADEIMLTGHEASQPVRMGSPRRRAQVTSVGNGIGVSSIRGSIGVTQSTVSPNPAPTGQPLLEGQPVPGTEFEASALLHEPGSGSAERFSSLKENESVGWGLSKRSLVGSDSSGAAPKRTPRSEAREQAGSGRTRVVQSWLDRE